MRMVRPRLNARQVTIAEEQDEYKPVTGALVNNKTYSAPDAGHQEGCAVFRLDSSHPHSRAVIRGVCTCDESQRRYNSVVLAFQPNAGERAAIMRGERIYLHLLTFAQPMQPVILSVGDEITAEMYGVEVAK